MVAVVRRPARRRGIATLEFVIVFPMLLVMVAAIFLMARADVEKTFVVTNARNDAWQKRATANPGNVLKLLNDPAASEAKGAATHAVVRSNYYAPESFTAEGKATAVGKTWDKEHLKFTPGRPHLDPHRDELTLLAENIPALASIVNLSLQVLGTVMSPERDVLMKAAAAVGKLANVLVVVAGFALHLLAAPLNLILDGLEMVVDILAIPAKFSKKIRKIRDFAKRIINLIRFGLNMFEALYQASLGKPGVWVTSIPAWLKDFKIGP